MAIRIVAKSSVEVEHIVDKLDKGAELIELHLFESDIDNDYSIEKSLSKISKAGAINNIVIVHCPINLDYVVEGLNSKKGFDIIKNTCYLGSVLGNDVVDIIIHQTSSLKQMKAWGLYSVIKDSVKKLLDTFRNIRINFENLMIINANDIVLELRNNYAFENINLCMQLRKDLNIVCLGRFEK